MEFIKLMKCHETCCSLLDEAECSYPRGKGGGAEDACCWIRPGAEDEWDGAGAFLAVAPKVLDICERQWKRVIRKILFLCRFIL